MDAIFSHQQVEFSSFPLREIGSRIPPCRFCFSHTPTFKNRSHSIPEFLGNKTIFTLDECDSCNEKFGNSNERHLKEFLLPNWLFRAKGKKGWASQNAAGGITIKSDEQVIDIDFPSRFPVGNEKIELLSRPINNLKAYKALVKILVSLLPADLLPEFSSTIKWLGCGRDYSGLNHKPLVLTGFQLPDIRLPIIMNVEVFRDAKDSGAVYLLEMKFNNLEIKLPFSTASNAWFRVGEVIAEEIPYKQKRFDFIDMQNAPVRKKTVINLDISKFM